MILSEPILPIRFYNSIFDQKRFNVHCSPDECTFDLVYAANQLPTFQFKRDSKFQLPTEFFLRNICKDKEEYNFYKIIPKGSDTFEPSDFYGEFPINDIIQFDSGGRPIYGDRPIIDVDCAKLVSIPLTGCDTPAFTQITIPLGFNDPINFQFKIIVDTFLATAGFYIQLKLYGNVVGVINSAGTFVFDLIMPDPNDGNLVIEFINYACGDYFSISYMQGIADFFVPATGDIVLDETDLTVLPNNDGKDIIILCGNTQANVPDGQYYYIVRSGDDSYFSEVFTIKRAKDLESYYKLTWWSECDINNAVIYNQDSLGTCQFKNTLFINGGLFKPEYDTKDEGEENGKGDINVTFQRWQKNLSFDAVTPEFLTDALSAIFLHKFAYVQRPLNNYQEVLDNEYRILKIVPDIEQVLSDCYQKVTLKLLLEDRYTDTECCEDANIISCGPCNYIAGDIDECGTYDYYFSTGFDMSDPPLGLYKCSDNSIVLVRPDEIICFNGTYIKLTKTGDVYTIESTAPRITSVTTGMIFYTIVGKVLPWTWATIQYQIDGGIWVTIDTVQGDENGNFSYLLPIYLSAGATTFDVRFNMVSLNCDYGLSLEYPIIEA